jgi:hypothetical protein
LCGTSNCFGWQNKKIFSWSFISFAYFSHVRRGCLLPLDHRKASLGLQQYNETGKVKDFIINSILFFLTNQF